MRREDVVDLTVADIMIPRPKTLPADSLVSDVRALLDGHGGVKTVILAEDGVFRGAIDRNALPADAPDHEPALWYADHQPNIVTPGTPMREAIPLLEGSREPRLIVLDEDGSALLGLVCAKPGAKTFCVR
jgi:CBS domain-containing protein